ncbi:MAG: hypothetical protein A2054_08685 [Deltaproteobacteria bacterium GWA2_55_10]|nr:MAG: hypothetical protein A2054_08685 [Deltaproteobacteria bacterium GWA2_55_10]
MAKRLAEGVRHVKREIPNIVFKTKGGIMRSEPRDGGGSREPRLSGRARRMEEESERTLMPKKARQRAKGRFL